MGEREIAKLALFTECLFTHALSSLPLLSLCPKLSPQIQFKEIDTDQPHIVLGRGYIGRSFRSVGDKKAPNGTA